MRVLFVAEQLDYEPNGFMHISSVLKKAGHEVDLVIADKQDPVQYAKEFMPDVLGFSVITGSQHFYLNLNRRIKETVDAFSVFGGPHPTFFPEMVNEPGVDGVCIGEGEYALLDLVDRLEKGSYYYDTPNWWFKEGDKLHRNPVRPLIDNLEELPLPDRELIYGKHRVLQNSKIKHFMTGRGCPYNCSYCFNHAYYEWYEGKGKRIRQLPVEHVIAEINSTRAKYPLEFVVFLDDTFILSRSWLMEFAEKYPRQVGLPFYCNVRANLVSLEQARLLKQAGCVSAGMGLEAGNDELRNLVLKRNLSKEQIIGACRTLREVGINVTTTNMLGLPKGTLANDFETLELNIACKPSYAYTFLFQPYPRTQLGEYAKSEGCMVGSFEDISDSAGERSILKFGSEKEKRQIERLQRLFAIAVEFPVLVPLVKLMINLPDNPIFWLVHKIHKGYAIKKRIHPHHLSPREYASMVLHYMKQY